MHDIHLATHERGELGEHRWRWSEVGRPIRDGTRSASVPKRVIEVEGLDDVPEVEVFASNCARKGASSRPGHAHRNGERIARPLVEDRNGRAQARRGEVVTDLEN